MTSTRFRSPLLATCAALAITAGIAHAATADPPADSATTHQHTRMHRHGGQYGSPLLGTLRQLDLTAEQRQSIQSIFAANADSRRTLRERQRTNQQSLAATLPDDPAYAALIADRKSLAVEAIQQASDTQIQVYSLLTDAQKAKVPQLLAQRKADREQRGERRRPQRESSTAM